MAKFDNPFPARLRALRLAAGFTIPALAEASGLFRTALNKLENGERAPTWATVCALADALKVKTEAFR